MGSWIQSIQKEGSDLPTPNQIFQVPHLPKPAEPWFRKKTTVHSIPTPTTRRQICEFLGVAGFYQIWIPNFSLLAKTLHEATKRREKEPLIWESKQQQSFRAIKEALVSAPALGLPDVRKPFFLFVHE
jgi:hypothetical protein